jgi:hypothetical protein
MEKKSLRPEVLPPSVNVGLMQLIERGSDFTINAQALREFLSDSLQNMKMSTRPPPKTAASK